MNNTTVYLFGIKGYRNSESIDVPSGLYEVVEYCGIEPSAYIFSPYYLICSADSPHDDWEDNCYEIDVDDFESQVNPKSYGRNLAQEKEIELEQELEYERVGY